MANWKVKVGSHRTILHDNKVVLDNNVYIEPIIKVGAKLICPSCGHEQDYETFRNGKGEENVICNTCGQEHLLSKQN
jgi:uncharacterized protein (DUF983 family)